MESGLSRQECPLISVITVCFNAADSIEGTILSVLDQSYPSIEYIVVDGGSTDGTLDIISKYTDRISAYISEPDNGIYDAMNKGLSLAHGEWVNFRNSGDRFISPDAVSSMFEYPVDEDVAVVHGDCIYKNSWGYKRVKPSILHSSYQEGMPVLHPASFIRTSVHIAHPFNLDYRLSGDYDFMYHCCQRGERLEYRPVAVSEFETGGTATRNLKDTYLEDCRIKGICGTARARLGYWAVCMKATALSLVEKVPVLAELRKERLKDRGWKDLPYSPEDL